jgi:hypothetical protein
MVDEALIQRIDRITTILRLANAEGLERMSKKLRAEPAKTAILDVVGSTWMPTKRLQDKAVAHANVAARTIRDHLAELVELGVLERRGEARSTEYRNAGVI